MYYELLTPKDPLRLALQLRSYGEAKCAALSFIVMEYGVNSVLNLETVLLAYEVNLAMPDHHPMFDRFGQEDIEFLWNYLIKNQLIKAVTEH